MIKRNPGTLVMLLALLVCSCSIVSKVGVMKQKVTSEWHQERTGYTYSTFDYSTPAYSLTKDSLQVLLCPCPKPAANVLIGPPFVPIIPNPYALFGPTVPNEFFFVDVRFINHTTKTKVLNLAAVTFQHKQDRLHPSTVAFINHSSFGYVPNNNLQRDVIANFSDASVFALNPSDSITVRYQFGKLTTDVKSLLVKFDTDENNQWLPSLQLKTKSVFVYRPLYDQ